MPGEQKTLSFFGEYVKSEHGKLKIEEKRNSANIKRHDRIETDYYEKSRVDTCARLLIEKFNVNIEIFHVRYGSSPPLNEKVYGYYMIITIKSGDRDRIVQFIRDELRLKTY